MIDFSFITVGEFVRWTDPAGKTSGIYEVYEIRKSGKELVSDDIILIGNANSEAEVTAAELQPHHTKKNIFFTYLNHSFLGYSSYGKKANLREVLSNCHGSILNRENGWNTTEFPSIADQNCFKPFDIFLMDGKYTVIPCNNYLAFWGEDSYNAYQKDKEWTKRAIALTQEYDTLRTKAVELLKEYLDNHGEQEFDESDGVAISAEYHDGWIVEEVVRLLQSSDGSLILETTSEDGHTELSRHDLLPAYMKILKSLNKRN